LRRQSPVRNTQVPEPIRPVAVPSLTMPAACGSGAAVARERRLLAETCALERGPLAEAGGRGAPCSVVLVRSRVYAAREEQRGLHLYE
jgi:hypothetical protein